MSYHAAPNITNGRVKQLKLKLNRISQQTVIMIIIFYMDFSDEIFLSASDDSEDEYEKWNR